MAISSTDCRRRAGASEPVWYLVPDGVVQYIAKYGLYQQVGSGAPGALRSPHRDRTIDQGEMSS